MPVVVLVLLAVPQPGRPGRPRDHHRPGPRLCCRRLRRGGKAESAAKKVKEGIAPQIRGLRGTTGDWRVSLGKPGDPRDVIDEDAIAADYAARGEPVPMTTKPGELATAERHADQGRRGQVSASRPPVYGDVHNPADVEQKIEETKNRIAAGVKIVTDAEREGR